MKSSQEVSQCLSLPATCERCGPNSPESLEGELCLLIIFVASSCCGQPELFSELFYIYCRAWNLTRNWSVLGEDRGHARQVDTTSSIVISQFNCEIVISPITIPSESAFFFVHPVKPENNFMSWFNVWNEQSLHFHPLRFQTQPQCPFCRS